MQPDGFRPEEPQDLPAPVRLRGVRHFLLFALGALAAIDAVIESLRQNWAVALPTSIVALLTLIVLGLSRRPRFARLPERYALGVMSIFLAIAGLTQWHRPSNLVWIPLYPFAFYLLGELRAGTWLSALGLLLLVSTYIAYPLLHDVPAVPPAHAVQVLFAFGMAGLIAYLYERIRTRQQALLREQAAADYLTGLPNRRGFFQIAATIAGQSRRSRESFSVILFDLDDFKSVNDRHGHDAGDRLLCEASRLVQASIRQGDALARWGGEEFVILLPRTAQDAAIVLAEKLRLAIAGAGFAPVERVTASFGVAEAATRDNVGDVINRADRALYRAKRAGRNRVEAESSP